MGLTLPTTPVGPWPGYTICHAVWLTPDGAEDNTTRQDAAAVGTPKRWKWLREVPQVVSVHYSAVEGFIRTGLERTANSLRGWGRFRAPEQMRLDELYIPYRAMSPKVAYVID